MIKYFNLTAQQYVEQLLELISAAEGPLYVATQPKDDENWTIGFGYTFSRDNNVELWSKAGISLSLQDQALLAQIDAAPSTQRNGMAAAFSRRLTIGEAKGLLNQTYTEYEKLAQGMPMSLERVAFVSVIYNRGESVVKRRMTGFMNAVAAGRLHERRARFRDRSAAFEIDVSSLA